MTISSPALIVSVKQLIFSERSGAAPSAAYIEGQNIANAQAPNNHTFECMMFNGLPL